MRPSQMGRLQVDDFRLDEPIPYVAVPRGKGGRIAAVPLVPEGIAAARAFLAARAFGAWSRGSANKALRAPARRAGRPPFTVYQIRHSFAAGLRRTETDVADIQDLYGHTSPENHHDLRTPRTRKSIAPQWNDCVRAMASGQSRWPAYLRRHHPDERCQSQRQTANSDDRHCSSGTSASTSVLTRQHARKCRDDVTSPGAAAAPPLGTSFRISLTPTPAAPRPPAGQYSMCYLSLSPASAASLLRPSPILDFSSTLLLPLRRKPTRHPVATPPQTIAPPFARTFSNHNGSTTFAHPPVSIPFCYETSDPSPRS